MEGDRLTHVDESGSARMVDVGGKDVTRRVARAGARVWMAAPTMALLEQQAFPKGDVLAVARVAGIMAAKRTADLVPLCHPLALNHVEVQFAVMPAESRVDIECVAKTDGRTGVEMEAIVGATIAAVTIYDMCKAVDRAMVIGDVRLIQKTGGRHDYCREDLGSPDSVVQATAADDSAQAGEDGRAAPQSVEPQGGGTGASGTVVSVNVSSGKGERKKPVDRVVLREEHGIEGDGHAGPWHRQVSLLADESIDKMVAKGLDVGAGDFAENITTRGIELPPLPIGTRMELGTALVEVTQIGKVCHDHCAIYYQAGDCVMPREGIFVKVLRGGEVAPGDAVRVLGGDAS